MNRRVLFPKDPEQINAKQTALGFRDGGDGEGGAGGRGLLGARRDSA